MRHRGSKNAEVTLEAMLFGRQRKVQPKVQTAIEKQKSEMAKRDLALKKQKEQNILAKMSDEKFKKILDDQLVPKRIRKIKKPDNISLIKSAETIVSMCKNYNKGKRNKNSQIKKRREYLGTKRVIGFREQVLENDEERFMKLFHEQKQKDKNKALNSCLKQFHKKPKTRVWPEGYNKNCFKTDQQKILISRARNISRKNKRDEDKRRKNLIKFGTENPTKEDRLKRSAAVRSLRRAKVREQNRKPKIRKQDQPDYPERKRKQVKDAVKRFSVRHPERRRQQNFEAQRRHRLPFVSSENFLKNFKRRVAAKKRFGEHCENDDLKSKNTSKARSIVTASTNLVEQTILERKSFSFNSNDRCDEAITIVENKKTNKITTKRMENFLSMFKAAEELSDSYITEKNPIYSSGKRIRPDFQRFGGIPKYMLTSKRMYFDDLSDEENIENFDKSKIRQVPYCDLSHDPPMQGDVDQMHLYTLLAFENDLK